MRRQAVIEVDVADGTAFVSDFLVVTQEGEGRVSGPLSCEVCRQAVGTVRGAFFRPYTIDASDIVLCWAHAREEVLKVVFGP